MVRRLLAGVMLAAGLAACKPAAPPPAAPTTTAAAAAVPQMKATVVTLRTTTEPAHKNAVSSLMIADGKARFRNEADRWRLFDLDKKNVTFVDELTKSYRTVSFESLLAERRKSLADSPGEAIPRATFEKTASTQQIAGATATQYVIRMGRYQRQLWIGKHPAIPAALFAMMTASQPATTPIDAAAREPVTAMLTLEGFPLRDRSDLPYDDKTMSVERVVEKVEETNVPADSLSIPAGYKDASLPAAAPASTAPAAGRPAAASSSRGRTAPATGSRLFARSQRSL